MTRSLPIRMPVTRAVVVGAILVGLPLLLPDAATAAPVSGSPAVPALAAAPSIPGIPDCKDAPIAQLPDHGVAAALDPAPSPPPRPGDPFEAGSATSIYDQYGYAGLRWHTYDLGCGGGIRDPQAAIDTMVGNLALSAAVFVTALTNGLHNQVAQPGTYLAPLDKVVAQVTTRLREAIWSPWGGVSLLAVASLLFVYSLRGNLSRVTSAALWAFLVLAVFSALTAYPSGASTFFDTAVTQTIGNLQAGSAGLATSGVHRDGRAQGALTVDVVLYDGWARGLLGSTTTSTSRQWAARLFAAQALTRAEAASTADPAQRTQLLETKAQEWEAVAEEISEDDPATYAVLQGKAGGRTGAGFLTLAATLFTVGFRCVADGFLVAGLVMLRLIVMFFPAAAVVGILAPLSGVVRRLGDIAAASVINVVAFAAASVVHTIAVGAVLSSAQGVGMSLMALLVCLVLTITAFVLMLPFLSLTRMLGRRSHSSFMTGVKRNLIRYAVNRKATGDGTIDATGHPEAPPPSERTIVNDPPRSETYRRATPIWDVTSDHRDRPAPQPVGARAIRGPVGESPTNDTPEAGPFDPGGSRPPGPPRPPQPGGGGAVPATQAPVIVGSVIDPEQQEWERRVIRTHDGNSELHDDGSIGYRVFDPATDGPDGRRPDSDEGRSS